MLTQRATHIRIPMAKRGAVDLAVGADWIPDAGDVSVIKYGSLTVI